MEENKSCEYSRKGEFKMSKPKIYCFINGGTNYFMNVAALAEDGTTLAGHASSNEYWAQHDIGILSDWKHENYQKHYPNGFELVWLNDPEKSLREDESFKNAIELANEVSQ
jgi:hypothetical protein